jgi:hypothetical protein
MLLARAARWGPCWALASPRPDGQDLDMRHRAIQLGGGARSVNPFKNQEFSSHGGHHGLPGTTLATDLLRPPCTRNLGPCRARPVLYSSWR